MHGKANYVCSFQNQQLGQEETTALQVFYYIEITSEEDMTCEFRGVHR